MDPSSRASCCCGDNLTNIACYLQCGFPCSLDMQLEGSNDAKYSESSWQLLQTRQDFNNVAYGFHWWSDQEQFLMQVKQIFYQYPTYVTTHSAHLSWTARPPQKQRHRGVDLNSLLWRQSNEYCVLPSTWLSLLA
jgi:hypothetical protein